MTQLRLENVIRCYRERQSGRTFDALRVHELDIGPGEVLSVIGPNGAGKSTLLETIAFLQRPNEGRVLLDGVDVWTDGDPLAARRQIPMLLQNTLLFTNSVLSNVMFGLRVRGLSAKAAKERAGAARDRVALRHLAHRRHTESSGGEKRRVALARVLALDSPIIVLDEPTASLDRDSERLIEGLIRRVSQERGTTVVMASHNHRQALSLATRVVTLLNGDLIEGTLDNLFAGELTVQGDRVTFAGERGLKFAAAVDRITADEWLGARLENGPCRIAIDASGIEVWEETSTNGGDAILRGTVDSLRQRGPTCRVRLEAAQGVALHMELPVNAHLRRGINLGSHLRLGLRAGAVRLLPPA